MTLLYFDNACVGELEASLIDSFLRAAKLRRWLNSSVVRSGPVQSFGQKF